MNVVLDTNVLVSAGLTPHGKSAQAFNAVINSEKTQLFYSLEIFAEYEEVLSRPKLKLSNTVQQFYLNAVKAFGKLITPSVSTMSMPDENDRIFYDTAKEAGAVLVTGNIKDYPNEDFIITPAQFKTILNKEPVFK
jgi:putative PIN family toxin of toxin-antitoxin system